MLLYLFNPDEVPHLVEHASNGGTILMNDGHLMAPQTQRLDNPAVRLGAPDDTLDLGDFQLTHR